MKKLLSFAAVLCTVALVGCSKGNKAEQTDATAATEQNADTGVLPAGFVLEGEQLLDSAGNVIANVVDGAYVDAKGNIIGTVEAVEAKYNEIKENVKNLSGEVADSVKNVATNVKDGVKDKATEIVDNAKAKGSEVIDNAKEKGANVVDKVKDGVANTLDKTGEALQNGAKKLEK